MGGADDDGELRAPRRSGAQRWAPVSVGSVSGSAIVLAMPPRLLLLQIRDQGGVRVEEVESFARHAGVPVSAIAVHNVFDQPAFGPEVLAGCDALLVGGASEASAMAPERFPFVAAIAAVLHEAIDRQLPTFASCFGFQVAVVGLGGELIRDDEGFEMGTIPLRLTPAAASDPLFAGLPNPLVAVSCHRERTQDTPRGTTALAETDACLHAFRVDGAPFWAFQFHPELDRQRFVERLGVFRSGYTDDDGHYERTIARFQETPDSNALVRRFVERL